MRELERQKMNLFTNKIQIKQDTARGEVANRCHTRDRPTDLQTDGLQELLEWPLATKNAINSIKSVQSLVQSPGV